jgi:hypothetical protein
MQNWMNLGVSGQCSWPTKQIKVAYGTTEFILLPRTKESSASIHMELTRKNSLEAMTTINRFLSVISWAYKGSIQNDYGWSGNPTPTPVPPRTFAWSSSDAFLIKWNPVINSKQKLALALYREARNINSIPYEFLGYFKSINILYKSGQDQMAWIKSTLLKLEFSFVQDRISKILESETDIAKYLYESGRCAIAHAFAEPLVDPDDLVHLHRLHADMNIARALAEYLIQHELGVPDYP